MTKAIASEYFAPEIVRGRSPEPCRVALGVPLERLEVRLAAGPNETPEARGRCGVGGWSPRCVGHVAAEGGPVAPHPFIVGRERLERCDAEGCWVQLIQRALSGVCDPD